MPARIWFLSASLQAWTPASDGVGIEDVRFHAIGEGGAGASGDGFVMAGGGGGGGERARSLISITDPNEELQVRVPVGGEGLNCFVQDTMFVDLVSASPGANAVTTLGGAGGTGGTGNEATFPGGAGADAGADSGGGGGSGAFDAATGNAGTAGSGTTGGAGGGTGTQMEISGRGNGGAGGNTGQSGNGGALHGGGGGGSAITGTGGAGHPAIMIASWGASLAGFPWTDFPETPGFYPDETTTSAWFMLL